MEHKAALEIDRPDRDDGHDNPLSRTRARGVRLISTAFWVLAIGFALIVGNAYLAATERWLRLLESARRPLGFSTPAGPDWYLIVGLGLAAVVPAAGPTARSVSRVCASPSGDPADWDVLWAWCSTAVPPPPYTRNAQEWKPLIAKALNKLLLMPGCCTVSVRWSGEYPQPALLPTRLLGLVAKQLLHALGGSGRSEKCSGCGVTFTRNDSRQGAPVASAPPVGREGSM